MSSVLTLARWIAQRRRAEASTYQHLLQDALDLQHQLVAYLQRLHSIITTSRTVSDAQEQLLADGCLLRPDPSTIPEAGTGVFLAGGTLARGAIATLYPGLVYTAQQLADLAAAEAPADDACAPSLPAFTAGNHYLLSYWFLGRQQLLVDGQPRGLSARRFAAAAAAAEEEQGQPVANTAWLEPDYVGGGATGSSSWLAGAAAGTTAASPAWENCSGGEAGRGVAEVQVNEGEGSVLRFLQQQAALGHLANHPPPGSPPTLAYDICPLPPGLPPHLLHFVPNLDFGGAGGGAAKAASGIGTGRWVVVLRAAEEVQFGVPELFMSYGRDPLSLGYTP